MLTPSSLTTTTGKMNEIKYDGTNPLLLMQDINRALHLWFASRVDARWTVRKVFYDN
jgi:hypothetical protein